MEFKFLTPATVTVLVDGMGKGNSLDAVRAAYEAEIVVKGEHEGLRIGTVTLNGPARLDQVDGAPLDEKELCGNEGCDNPLIPGEDWNGECGDCLTRANAIPSLTVAAITYAAVQLLDKPWAVESSMWGDACTAFRGDAAFGVDIDRDDRLIVGRRGGAKLWLESADPADGLDALAARVADALRHLDAAGRAQD